MDVKVIVTNISDVLEPEVLIELSSLLKETSSQLAYAANPLINISRDFSAEKVVIDITFFAKIKIPIIDYPMSIIHFKFLS